MSLVTLDWHDTVAVITLNRPEAANAISVELAEALGSTAKELAREDRARAVVLRAAGKMFSGGGDVAAMLSNKAQLDRARYGKFFEHLVAGFHDAVRSLHSINAPLVAAVNGAAAGGGMSLALACDIVLASPRAKFVPAYPGIGLSTDGGMSWTLTRAVGQRKAMQILLENRAIGADEAVSLGIISTILSDDDFDAAVLEQARALARLPRKAMVKIRQLIADAPRHSLDLQLDIELMTIARLAIAPDAFEGLDAFSARRAPAFTD